MATQSSIEWTESTWNPVIGCDKVSAGCKHCYAERMAKRLASMARALEAKGQNPGRLSHYTKVLSKNHKWNGRLIQDPDALLDPLGWRAPRTIFVNSMSDLFHPDVPLVFIRQVFSVMNRCPQHTFQILTKRPEITAQYDAELNWTPNIWMGTSVERADVVSRIDDLRRTSAHIHFLSIEPLIGPLNDLDLSHIEWAIVGGESGPGARPMKESWVRSLRDQCLAADVPFFFKQWGGIQKHRTGRELDGRIWDEMPNVSYEVDAVSI